MEKKCGVFATVQRWILPKEKKYIVRVLVNFKQWPMADDSLSSGSWPIVGPQF